MANLTDSAFTRLLTQAAKAAYKHRSLCDRVNDECIARYGVGYSEVDADTVIDTIDLIGGEYFSAEEFHEAMTLSDCERVDLKLEKLLSLSTLTVEQQEEVDEIQRRLSGIE
ncbi:hypothetical protein [Enterovibrio paralichthyis]|uniref:hypothetical protein n=1 Tax=Enterovibrio paralichthyis TaxID=2853805 RepID=UPI001C45D91F|nr:hypothetical protein [Enterovibrio paralichthyis]MBV7300231.1 hypothetical protein [Enterovibrio paralichthyis]